MRAPKSQTCVFCWEPGVTHTRDHVPPQGLLPKPRPATLITVPACKQCNGGSNLDDEFMQRLALAIAAGNNPAAQQVGWNVVRAMNKPDKRGMRRGIQKTLTPVQLYSPMGLYLGPTYQMRLDGNRLRRILRKITVGMLWEVTRRRMKERRTRNFSESDVPRLPPNYVPFVHAVGSSPDHEAMRTTENNIPRLLPPPPHSQGYVYLPVLD
jgi:hypothetical protein